MRLEGSFDIDQPRDLVWQKIKDPTMMAGSIPGCENIEQIDGQNYTATVGIKVGIIKASFNLAVEVTKEIEPSELHSRTTGQEGSRASMVTTESVVTLSEIDPQKTRLDYTSDVMVSGRLGKYGLGMMKKQTDRLAEEFAQNFNRALSDDSAPDQISEETQIPNAWQKFLGLIGIGSVEETSDVKPVPMPRGENDQLLLPQTTNEALSQLSNQPERLPISGGATLVAMLNANLIDPSALVNLKAIPELAEINLMENGSIRIGALSRHAMTASSDLLVGSLSGVKNAASKIANPTVRNMGTMGGSIAFADPAADYAPALVAAEAEIEIASLKGVRRVSATDFFVDWYKTALNDGEIVQAIYLPKPDTACVAHHEKFARVEGDFATVSVNIILKLDGSICQDIRVAVGACGPTPVRDRSIEKTLIGTSLSEQEILQAGKSLAEQCDPIDDVRGSASYRLKLVPQLLLRAIEAVQRQFVEGEAA